MPAPVYAVLHFTIQQTTKTAGIPSLFLTVNIIYARYNYHISGDIMHSLYK